MCLGAKICKHFPFTVVGRDVEVKTADRSQDVSRFSSFIPLEDFPPNLI